MFNHWQSKRKKKSVSFRSNGFLTEREKERMKDESQSETCELRKRTPAAMAIPLDVFNKNLIFFRSPRPFLQTLLITTRCPSHLYLLFTINAQRPPPTVAPPNEQIKANPSIFKAQLTVWLWFVKQASYTLVTEKKGIKCCYGIYLGKIESENYYLFIDCCSHKYVGASQEH